MNTKQAGFWRRLIATLIDISILGLVNIPSLYFLSISKTIPDVIYHLFALFLIFIASMLLQNLYSAICIYYFYGTPGKLITGIHIVNAHEQRLSFKRILFREYIGYFFSALVFGLGYWSIITDKHKQAWHDKIVDSYVIARQPQLWIVGLFLLLCLGTGQAMFLSQQVNQFMKGPVVKQIQQNIAANAAYEKTKKQQEKAPTNYPENIVSEAFYKKVETMRKLQEERNLPELKRQAPLLLVAAKTPAEKAVAYNWMGITANELQDPQKAAQYYGNAIKTYPTYTTAYANLSMVQRFDLRDDVNAVKNAQKAVTLTPNDDYAHYALGLALFDSGKEPEGIAEVQQAIELDPENEQYKKTLAELVKLSGLTPSEDPNASPTPAPTRTFGYEVSPQTINITIPAGTCQRAFTAKYTGTGANTFRLSPYTIGDPAIHWDSTEYMMDRPMPAFVGICVDSSFTNHNETRSATVMLLDRNSGKSIPLSITVTVP